MASLIRMRLSQLFELEIMILLYKHIVILTKTILLKVDSAVSGNQIKLKLNSLHTSSGLYGCLKIAPSLILITYSLTL